ncbi:MAG: protein-S-isoprenylcysteine O-methyltransferase Ste14 [Phycisphaerales bacterium]
MLGFGLFAYTVFFGTFLYMIGFVADHFVPKGINDGPAGPLWLALAINTALVLLFAAQHEIMARPWFKAIITRFIPVAIERSVFVLLSSGILLLMFWQWRPITGELWNVTGPAAWGFWAVAALGWFVVLGSTFIINHFDLFGLRQTVLHATGREYTAVGFKLRFFYKVCRHPLMLGFIIAFWATPVMTYTRLLFAGLMTLFVLVGVQFEEKDLIADHGDDYREYKKQVRGLVPLPKKNPQVIAPTTAQNATQAGA